MNASIVTSHCADTSGRELPLSDSQHLLRFFETLYPGSAFGPRFTMSASCRITGPLDVEALRASVQDVVDRHESLRTVIVQGDGLPFQRVLAAVPEASLVVRDHAVAADQREAAIDDFLTEMDVLEHGVDDVPLISAILHRFADDDAALAVVTHHTASDAVSNQILMRDIVAFYEARVTGQPPVCAEPFIQYGDYVLMQQEAAEEARREVALRYWERNLAGVPAVALPTDHPRPATVSGRQGLLRFDLDEATTAKMISLSRESRTTTFMVLVAAFALLYSQLTNARDFVIPTLTAGRFGLGAVPAGRKRLETRNTVGFFVNAQLLRTRLADDPTLAEVLQTVRSTCLEAYANEAPILRVLEAAPDAAMLLADERFVLMPFQFVPFLTVDRMPMGPLCHYEPIALRPRSVRGMALPLDSLWTMRLHRCLLGNISFSADLFDEERVVAMSRGFVSALELLVAKPWRRLSNLDLWAHRPGVEPTPVEQTSG